MKRTHVAWLRGVLMMILSMPAQGATADNAAQGQSTVKSAGTPTAFSIAGDHFMLGDKPFVIRSGEMHYARVPRELWHDRLAKLHAMGLNTVSTYVFWNLHEPRPGVFDFSGGLDIAAFIKAAQEEGLWVILRPSPYVCAEWEFGGLPSWLLKDHDIKVRTSDPRFVAAASRFIKRVGEETSGLLVQKGGPILLVQVENEYGSFGTDRAYVDALKEAYRSAGFSGQLYTGDSVWGRPNAQQELPYSTFEDALVAVNFGQTADPAVPMSELTKFRPGSPKMCGEYWVGWFDHVGAPHARKDTVEAAKGIEWMLQNGVSFNLYMFHGGTSFGFMNGANWDKELYQPDTTSYDYDAPLDEAGRPTPKYFVLRSLIQKYLPAGEKLREVPPTPSGIKIPPFTFSENAPLAALVRASAITDAPQSMEDLGQSYGFILYRHQMKGAYKGILEVRDVHDYALLYQGDRRLGILDRRLRQSTLDVSLEAGKPLDILVENMGRINFSPMIAGERKGITRSVVTEEGELKGWESVPLPLNDLSTLSFGKKPFKGPAFYRATFKLTETGDTFIDVRGWGKGVVFVNGRNLGRFWSIGPQRTLYCPASWLKAGVNEIIVLDLFDRSGARPVMQGLAEPVFD